MSYISIMIYEPFGLARSPEPSTVSRVRWLASSPTDSFILPSPLLTSGSTMENAAANPSAAAAAAAAAAAGNGVQASGAGGERPEDASKQNLAQVTSSIQKTLGLLHQLNLTVSSFNSASQLPLLQRL
jgi:hypothetical protein